MMLGQCEKTVSSSSRRVINLVQRRYRYKPKWAVQLKSKSNCQRALDHFDAFYKPIYGDLWPSTRLSLLSLPKHCAVLNKYTDTDRVISKLENLGCNDFLQPFKDADLCIQSAPDSVSNYGNVHNHFSDFFEEEITNKSSVQNSFPNSEIDLENTSEYEMRKRKGPAELPYVLSADSLEPFDEQVYKKDLEAFVPPQKVLSEKEELVREEVQAVSFQSRDINVDVVPMEPIRIPKQLKVFIFPPRDVSRFPQPKAYSQKTGYYLMDAGSTLPVIALNLNPSDRVLDLCAAPGGKSLAMIQALDFSNGAQLHCNDVSQGRLVRLKNILSSYLPNRDSQHIDISHLDGVGFQSLEFDKILVDVPCNSDRHVVTEEDNNLFKQSRTRERLSMMRLQANLLVSAIRLCRVGGSIVYSTCTMAPAQNDGVIQAAVETLSETSKIKVAVEDLTPLSDAFKDSFRFYDKCRFGQLVLPSLANNFGPTYFAKLMRLH